MVAPDYDVLQLTLLELLAHHDVAIRKMAQEILSKLKQYEQDEKGEIESRTK